MLVMRTIIIKFKEKHYYSLPSLNHKLVYRIIITTVVFFNHWFSRGHCTTRQIYFCLNFKVSPMERKIEGTAEHTHVQ